MEYDGYFADAAVTVPVGEITPELKKLLQVTRESLDHAIEKVRVGNRLSDIRAAVQDWAERKNGYSVVRDLCGHGIGTHIHEEPNVLELRLTRPWPAAARGNGLRDRADGEYRRSRT